MVQKTYTFHVHGMHCATCVLLTENELSGLPNISRVKSNLQNHSVEVSGDFSALGGSAFGGKKEDEENEDDEIVETQNLASLQTKNRVIQNILILLTKYMDCV